MRNNGKERTLARKNAREIKSVNLIGIENYISMLEGKKTERKEERRREGAETYAAAHAPCVK